MEVELRQKLSHCYAVDFKLFILFTLLTLLTLLTLSTLFTLLTLFTMLTLFTLLTLPTLLTRLTLLALLFLLPMLTLFTQSKKLCSKKAIDSTMQGGRTWQPFVGSKNGNANFRQTRIYNFRVGCVV